ncbi:unnamed protein product [marine sediment metagenome]|uniref:Uncharacterized protein n=1 Tax=marine sediment metagenome TaxID=412755 RepID=X1VLT2_9ZZZZ
MISLFARQLSYIAEKQSYAAIARSTGIPYRSVLAMREGKIKISSVFKKSIRNMYQREAYGRLKDTGFSSSQARRWSWYKPEKVVVQTYSLSYKIGELATGALAGKLKKEGLDITKVNVDDLFDEMYEKIKIGIQISIEPTEIWFDY